MSEGKTITGSLWTKWHTPKNQMRLSFSQFLKVGCYIGDVRNKFLRLRPNTVKSYVLVSFLKMKTLEELCKFILNFFLLDYALWFLCVWFFVWFFFCFCLKRFLLYLWQIILLQLLQICIIIHVPKHCWFDWMNWIGNWNELIFFKIKIWLHVYLYKVEKDYCIRKFIFRLCFYSDYFLPLGLRW